MSAGMRIRMRNVYAPANHPAAISAVRHACRGFVCGGDYCVEGRGGGGFVIRTGALVVPGDRETWQRDQERLRVVRDEYPLAADLAGNFCGRIAGSGGHGISGVAAQSAR